eukprot:1157885-Pelagomonas_calceolata.AAC.3
MLVGHKARVEAKLARSFVGGKIKGAIQDLCRAMIFQDVLENHACNHADLCWAHVETVGGGQRSLLDLCFTRYVNLEKR